MSIAGQPTWSALRFEADLRANGRVFRDLTPAERWCLVAGVLPIAAYSPFKGRLLIAERAAVDADEFADLADVPLRVAKSLMRKLKDAGRLLWDEDLDCWYLADLGFHWDRTTTGAERWSRDRYARFAGAAGFFSEQQIRARVEFYGGICWICRAVPYQAIDHVKPLARGGSNWPSNLRPVCRECNSRKGAKWPYARRAGTV